jgi:hypothetical protein
MSDTSELRTADEREDPWERVKRKYWGRDWDLDAMLDAGSDVDDTNGSTTD